MREEREREGERGKGGYTPSWHRAVRFERWACADDACLPLAHALGAGARVSRRRRMISFVVASKDAEKEKMKRRRAYAFFGLPLP